MVDIARDSLAQDALQGLIDTIAVFCMHELDKREQNKPNQPDRLGLCHTHGPSTF
jgi:hypothetical protein